MVNPEPQMTQIYTAAVTLIALIVYFALMINVGRARDRYGIKAPAVTGNENFERAYRIQMNTLEQLVLFLPVLWLYAVLVSDAGAAVGGLIWVVGRIIYALAYTRDPATRGRGVMITMLAQAGLFLGAVYGVARALIG
jgi:glutathione S-transferase